MYFFYLFLIYCQMGGMFGVMGIEDFSESVKRTGVNFLKGGLMIAAGF